MPNEGTYLLGRPTFTKLPNGRLRCVETGHELSIRDKESYSKGKRCRLDLVNYALAKKMPPLNMFIQDPDSRSNLICKLTGDSVSKFEEHIWKHINGRRFLSKLEKQEQEKQRAIELHEDGPARKKLKRENKKGNRKGKMIDESDSEPIESCKKKKRKSSSKGHRWDFDDGDCWASASELESQSEEGSDNGSWSSEEMPNKKKRKSIEIGTNRSASRKKISKKISRNNLNPRNIDEFARGSPKKDRRKAGKSFTTPSLAWTYSCEAPQEVHLDPEEAQENHHDLPIFADNIPLNSEDARDMNHETPAPKVPVAVAYGSFTSHGVVRDITHILKENFMGPYDTWSAIPPDIRELYWKKFQEKFIVEEEKYHEIKKVWELTSKRRYTSMLSEARREVLRKTGKKSVSETKGKGPTWMKPTIWNSIVDKWDTPQWKVKSQVARKNRMTEKDGSITKHSGGSVSFAEHKLRLANELRREPTQAELFQRLHKGKGSSGEFIDNKSKRVMEAYEDILAEKYGPECASQVTFDEEAWKKATGGPNKEGKLYGYGLVQHYPKFSISRVSSPCSSRSGGGPSQSSQISSEQLQEVLKANEELQSKIEEQKSEMEQQKSLMKQQQSQIEMMQAKMVTLMAELDGRRVLRPRHAWKENSLSD